MTSGLHTFREPLAPGYWDTYWSNAARGTEEVASKNVTQPKMLS
jgi:hypothetical protein